MALVGEHADPLIVGAELDDELLCVRIVGELGHLRCGDVDLVEVVLLVAAGVLREHDALVVAAPGEAGAERGRDLTVADLARLFGREVHDVELHATGLVPVEGDLVALP